jgi:hypothetical protein
LSPVAASEIHPELPQTALRERTDHMTTRAAGASALIDADLPDDHKPGLDTA